MIQLSAGSHNVLPTPTLLRTLHVQGSSKLAIEFANADVSQTLDVTMKIRATRTGAYTTSTYSGLAGIVAGTPGCDVIDVGGLIDVQFWGVASGIGLSATSGGTLSGAV